MQQDPIVDVRGLNHWFGVDAARRQALYDISLGLERGSFTILMGPSGSGKTTLLTLIGCLRAVQDGSVRLLSQELNGASEAQLVAMRRRLGFIFQAHNLLPFLTAAENVSLVLDLAGWAPEKGKERAKELLDYLEVGHRAPVKPALLSGGEAQRVAIARALANRPRIILADEPTAALDSKRAQLVMDLLRKLAAEQEACILTVTHDEKIFDRFDRLIHLRDGKLADE